MKSLNKSIALNVSRTDRPINSTGFLLISAPPTAPGLVMVSASFGAPRVRRSTAPKVTLDVTESRVLHAIATPHPGRVLDLVKTRLLDLGHAPERGGGYCLDAGAVYELCKAVARGPTITPLSIVASTSVPATLKATARSKAWQKLFEAPDAIPELASPLEIVLARAVSGSSAAPALEQLARAGVRCTFFHHERPLFAFTDEARRALTGWLRKTETSWNELLTQNKGSDVVACRISCR